MRRAPVDYEHLVLTFPREVTRGEVRKAVADHAEYGHWELARSVLYAGGLRRVWLKRRIIRVERTA